MEATRSWLTLCLCFVLGTTESGILCNPLIGKRQTQSCSIDMFTCTNGECIDLLSICDGFADCSDKSDETQNLCDPKFKTCPNSAFRCNYGACIAISAKCNGKDDCVDGSDEKLPECTKLALAIPSSSPPTQQTQVTSLSGCLPQEEYRCKSGQCIDITSICDGITDCNDKSDETLELCKSKVCPKNTFTCKYGACINKQRKCDGSLHCADGSDEAGCNSTYYIPSTLATPTTQTTLKPSLPIYTYQTTRPSTSIDYQTSQSPTQTNKKGTCMIPYMEGTVYSLVGTVPIEEVLPGTYVNHNTIVEETCIEGYYKTIPDGLKVCSKNGNWYPKIDKICLKRCPPMLSNSLDLECIYNGKIEDCSKPSIPGTLLTPKCKVTHTVPNGQIETPIKLLCQNDGNWSDRLYTCIPFCGRPHYVQVQTMILEGVESEYGSAPWNVGIYRKNINNFNLVCGGTLIASNLVVSAAHCFSNEEPTAIRILTNDGKFKIAVGKYKSDISIKDNEFTQIVDVGFIYLAKNYYGRSGNYVNDIAIIVLTSKVTISTVVAPACLDLTKKYSIPKNGEMGKVVGWGKTKKMTESPILLEANLPYINQSTCYKMYNNGFQKFISGDKFCAGTKSGQGVHQGDSGAGLTFVHNSLHFLTGVVSVKDTSTNDSIAVFTDVSHHTEWINEIYNNFTFASGNLYKT